QLVETHGVVEVLIAEANAGLGEEVPKDVEANAGFAEHDLVLRHRARRVEDARLRGTSAQRHTINGVVRRQREHEPLLEVAGEQVDPRLHLGDRTELEAVPASGPSAVRRGSWRHADEGPGVVEERGLTKRIEGEAVDGIAAKLPSPHELCRNVGVVP